VTEREGERRKRDWTWQLKQKKTASNADGSDSKLPDRSSGFVESGEASEISYETGLLGRRSQVDLRIRKGILLRNSREKHAGAPRTGRRLIDKWGGKVLFRHNGENKGST